MSGRNFYINIIIRLILILIIAVLSGYILARNQSMLVPFAGLAAIIILTFSLISFLDSTNRRISFFFDSVRNDDSNLTFPVDMKTKSLKELYKNMTKVSEQIQQLKIKNRQQEQYFQILLEQLAVGIITFNNKGFILQANSSAKKLLTADVLTHLQQIERIDHNLFETITAMKPPEHRSVSFATTEGEIQLSLKATSFKERDQELTILSIQDIKSELDEKELDSWFKLIRVLMHEIMNSITPITSLSESLTQIFIDAGNPVNADQVNDKTIATVLQGLTVIKDQGKGLMSFVESYRKLSHVPEPDKKFFKVTDLFTRVNILFNSLENNQRTELSCIVNDPDLKLFADENLISQVLINLLKNAIESNENNSGGKIRITANKNGSNTELCVIDNGPGISKENLDKIFVPFFTTRKTGSGIGLSLSKQIMRVHEGTIFVKSTTGKETKFCLTFNA